MSSPPLALLAAEGPRLYTTVSDPGLRHQGLPWKTHKSTLNNPGPAGHVPLGRNPREKLGQELQTVEMALSDRSVSLDHIQCAASGSTGNGGHK
jgi:hypothetical protein